jgi:hypothetical protein
VARPIRRPALAAVALAAVLAGGGCTGGGGGRAATAFDGNGLYRVGRDIQPGTYRTAGVGPETRVPPESGIVHTADDDGVRKCTWVRYAAPTASGIGAGTNVIAVGAEPSGPVEVTIEPTDHQFVTFGCLRWERVG